MPLRRRQSPAVTVIPARRRSAGGSNPAGCGLTAVAAYGRVPGEHSPRRWPPFQPGTHNADTLDEDAHHRFRPKIRLQLLPPKPNELLSTVSVRAGSLAS